MTPMELRISNAGSASRARRRGYADEQLCHGYDLAHADREVAKCTRCEGAIRSGNTILISDDGKVRHYRCPDQTATVYADHDMHPHCK